MRVLGISCYGRASAAAVVVDGQVVAAAAEERFSRIKNDSNFPQQAIQFCLKAAFCESKELDLVVFFEKPLRKFERIVKSALACWPKSALFFRESTLQWVPDRLRMQTILQEKLGLDKQRIVFCSHQMAEAAASYYTSDFTESALLTVDGAGEWAVGARGSGWDTQVHLDDEMHFPHSLGLLYETFTSFLGFPVGEGGEYKVMGMAAYGRPVYFDTIMKKLVKLESDGSFTLNMDYFSFHCSDYRPFTEKFCEIFGQPRPTSEAHLLDSHYADVAASIQKVAEEILVRQTQALRRKYGHINLCLSGSMALNPAANMRIYTESEFENIHIQPASGDCGGALGAALWGYYRVLGGKKRYRLLNPYLGQEYDDYAVADFLRSHNCRYQELADINAVYQEVAARLESGQVVGWMKGRFEWGPRALGARSILADPRSAHMRDLINARVKLREPFSPFAASVLAEGLEDYFGIADSVQAEPLRFMLMAVPVYEDRRNIIPAVTHADGTSRIQAVYRQESPYFYELINAFYQRTGIPMLLNTSFCLRGEPIVNTPAEALSAFTRSDMDALVMGRMLVSRRSIDDKRVISGAEIKKWSQNPVLAPVPPESQEDGVGVKKIAYKSYKPEGLLDDLGVVGRVLKYVALICLVLLGAELLTWLVVSDVDMQLRGIYVSGKDGLRLKPNWKKRVKGREFKADVRLNSAGWRELPALRLVDQFGSEEVRQLAVGDDDGVVSDAVASRRPGVGQTILALGDSFAFGSWSNVEDTWLNQIQRTTGAKVNCLAMPYAGTDSMAEIYRSLKPTERKADIVLLAFYTGNDFYENMAGRQSFVVSNGEVVLTPQAEAIWERYDCLKKQQKAVNVPGSNQIAWYKQFLRRSHLCRFIGDLFHRFQKRLAPQMAQAWFLNTYTNEMRQGVGKTREALEKIHKLCSERGSTMVVVIIPSSWEVYDADWQRWLDSTGYKPELFDRAKPRQIILDWAESKGVYALDLWPYLVNRPRMYYEHDIHLNHLGHFQSGEAVSQYLDRSGIFDLNVYDTNVIDSGNSGSNSGESMPGDSVNVDIDTSGIDKNSSKDM